jgi:hypothetical protein
VIDEVMTMAKAQPGPSRAWRHAQAFQQCPHCTYDLATGEGVRSCHYYDCPYLPEELNTVCPTCNFNFYTQDGQPGCGEEPTCDFARDEAPARVEALRYWVEHQGGAPVAT